MLLKIECFFGKIYIKGRIVSVIKFLLKASFLQLGKNYEKIESEQFPSMSTYKNSPKWIDLNCQKSMNKLFFFLYILLTYKNTKSLVLFPIKWWCFLSLQIFFIKYLLSSSWDNFVIVSSNFYRQSTGRRKWSFHAFFCTKCNKLSIFALKLSTFSISHSMQVSRNRVHSVKMDAIKFAAYTYLLDDVQSCIHNYYNILLALTKCLSFTFIQLSYWLKKVIIVIFIIIIIFIIINILFCFFCQYFDLNILVTFMNPVMFSHLWSNLFH